MAPKPAIEVEGLKEITRLLRKVEKTEIDKGLRQANKGAAEVVAAEAKDIVPVRSGRLKKSIGAKGDLSSGSIKAGTKGRVPYAGVIHWGWGRRRIFPQKFLSGAIRNKLPEARDVYEELFDEIMRVIETTGFRRR